MALGKIDIEEEENRQEQAGNEGAEVSWRGGVAAKLKMLFIKWSELKNER